MRHQRFYTLVGIFVIGALFLISVCGAFFYKQYMHAKIETFVMFFKGSLKGLDVSTPVTYRGVKIGEVRLIEITENKAGNNVVIPVYVEFFVEKTLGFTKNPIQLLIVNGFIADISKPNFLTGLADIELVKAQKLPTKIRYFRGYPIFPTRNSVEKYTSLDDSIKSANIMFNHISEFVQSKEIHDTLASTKAMADSFHRLSNNIDQYTPSVATSITQSLKKVSNAAESTQNLMDYLARYPESLLRGKK